MADINITTDGTVQNTKLTVDGKEVTKKEKVVSMDLYAYAPYKSSYSEDSYPGSVSISYSVANEDGTISRKSVSSGDDTSAAGIGQKIKMSDQVIRFMGQEADAKIATLVDKIIRHCEENKCACPGKELLLARTEQSLKDKAEDLGIVLETEDAKKKDDNND